MKALILAAGYGTRLYPLTKDKPKPLLTVGGKPMMEHVIDKLEAVEDIDKIYVVTNEKFFSHFQAWKSIYPGGDKIKIINDATVSDDDKIGAIGDIRLVIEKERIEDDLLVVAGDNLFNFNLNDLVNFFKKKGTAVGLYDFQDWQAVKRYGVVDIDSNHRIVGFQEKPSDPKTTLVSTCLYLFPREKLNLITRYLEEGNNPDAPGFYLAWLHSRDQIYGFTFEGSWYDIGDLKCYEEANNKYKKI